MANSPIVNSDLAGLEMTYIADKFVRTGRHMAMGKAFGAFMNVSDEIKEKGAAVSVPIGQIASSFLATEGSTITLDDTVPTTATVTLNKSRKYAFSRGQVAGALSGNSSLEVILDSAVTGVLNDLYTDVFSAITSGLTNTVGTYNTALTQATILAGVATLDNNKAPDKPRIGFVRTDANAFGSLVAINGFGSWNTTGVISPFAQEDFGQGHFYSGASWFRTAAMPKSTNNIDNCILTPGSLAVAIHPQEEPIAGAIAKTVVDVDAGIALTITAQHDIYKGVNVYVVSVLYGYSILDVNKGVLIKS